MKNELHFERNIFIFSLISTSVFAVIAIVWGILINSQMIIFDGLLWNPWL